ncbi:hypothetical protein CAPTEDRAFT_197315 [Capitella teleta]|uniref:Exoribonuclease phosphorolytic domain-containing protein n=1 Tax=Capitella teleta TaxID=283909 RepID=R7UFN2_CAPTE|nr:hypothetical protein CAPTEDRAFT_197315 [Capitella teleta]|eukprot:ELU02598.1 hypothetical protein CAPTEDRAFT_197315 [Capitella teleta]
MVDIGEKLWIEQLKYFLQSDAFNMAGMEVRQLLSDRGFRVHGRKPNELRRIQCRMGVYSQTDGSAYIEQGNTKVLAAVHGLHEGVLPVGDGYMECLCSLLDSI